MTNSPFLQLPVAISGGQGPLVNLADCRPIFPASIETDAYGHWDFSTDAGHSLASLIDGKALSLNGSAPTYYSDSLEIASGGMHGLLTDLDDRAAFTFCCCVKLQVFANNANLLFGTSTVMAGDGGGMGFLQWTATGGLIATMQTRPHANLVSATLSSLLAMITGSAWVFVAFTRDDASPRTIYEGSLAATVSDASALGAKTLATPMRKIGIGNCYYPTASHQIGARLAEAILFTGIKTTSELTAIAARSKARMQRKGILLANV